MGAVLNLCSDLETCQESKLRVLLRIIYKAINFSNKLDLEILLLQSISARFCHTSSIQVQLQF